MSFNLTPEQEAIVGAARNTSDSLLINALAGAAKTTTLCLLAAKLPLVPTLSLAFNKRIADEMAKRLPSHIESRTMNAIGHRVWGAKLGKRLVLEKDKMYDICSDLMGKKTGAEKKAFGDTFAGLLRATRLAKSAGYVPAEYKSAGKTLVSAGEFLDRLALDLDFEPNDEFLHNLDTALGISIGQGFSGKIDFDDQIYLSTLFGGNYPKYPVVLVDEAQDLSPLNHETLQLVFGGRLIAVGDPWQSIYGFRGAHQSSMGVLKDRFSMKELSLNVSFRCPQEVVRKAWFRVPQMQWAPSAPAGTVEALDAWTLSDIPEGSAIICRNNAPLFSLALRFIKSGRNVKIIGSEIGVALTKLLKKIGGDPLLPSEALASAIRDWEDRELQNARKSRHAGIHDRAACLQVFAASGKNLEEAVAFAEHLFAGSGTVQFLTGHKSKGGEWDTVFFLEPYLIPSKWAQVAAENGDSSQMEQELNLKYVITTRAKSALFYINLEDQY